MITKEGILEQLHINEFDLKNTIMQSAITEKLLLAAILNQGIETASAILKKYRELRDILYD